MTFVYKRPGYISPVASLSGMMREVGYFGSILMIGGEGMLGCVDAGSGRLFQLRDIAKGRKAPPFASWTAQYPAKLTTLGNGVTVLDTRDAHASCIGYRIPPSLFHEKAGYTAGFIFNRSTTSPVQTGNEDLLSINQRGSSTPDMTHQIRTGPTTMGYNGRQRSTTTGEYSSSDTTVRAAGFDTWRGMFTAVDAGDSVSPTGTSKVSVRTLTSSATTGTTGSNPRPTLYYNPAEMTATLLGRAGLPTSLFRGLTHRIAAIEGYHLYNDGGVGQAFHDYLLAELNRVLAT